MAARLAAAGLELGAEVVRPLPGTDLAAGQARELVRAVLGPGHPCLPDADVCVTELVSNAVAYTRSGWLPGGAVVVTVQAGLAAAVITVRDQGGPALPAEPRRDPGEHGRGLVLVGALSAEWGWSPAAGGGRVTWCRLEAPPPFCPESLVCDRPAYCDPAACCREAFAAGSPPARRPAPAAADTNGSSR